MSTKPPSRIVFIGNIPYDLAEEQIVELFSSAGKVLSFRLVYDRETGRPKGFGFAEYPDADSASSAVRNLHNYEIKGRRLRVDFSNEQQTGDDDGVDHAHSNANVGNPYPPNGADGGQLNAQGSLPPLPAGKDLPPGVTCTDSISRTLNTLPPAQLLDIIAQMKVLATNDPARAAELFQQAPQLAYAVFQAMLLMNLVSPESISSVIEQGGPPAPVVSQPPAMGYPAQPPAGYGAVPGPAMTNTPPVSGTPYPPPPQSATPAYNAPAAAPPAPQAGQNPDELMAAVMSLPQATIDALPPNERDQILRLRAEFSARR